MSKHIDIIANSYDNAITRKSGVNPYKNLPEHIVNLPEYQEYLKLNAINISDSGRDEVKDYLTPKKGQMFVDLGCCLNLMFNGYDKWESTYYGIDISSKTIDLVKKHVNNNNLHIGSLYCGGIHKIPYESNFFDIGACIGTLEYFEAEYVKKAILEMHRIMKPNGKLIIDVPNLKSSLYKINMLIEEHIGRPNKYNFTNQEFNNFLSDYFRIIKIENVVGMKQYFLTCDK